MQLAGGKARLAMPAGLRQQSGRTLQLHRQSVAVQRVVTPSRQERGALVVTNYGRRHHFWKVRPGGFRTSKNHASRFLIGKDGAVWAKRAGGRHRAVHKDKLHRHRIKKLRHGWFTLSKGYARKVYKIFGNVRHQRLTDRPKIDGYIAKTVKRKTVFRHFSERLINRMKLKPSSAVKQRDKAEKMGYLRHGVFDHVEGFDEFFLNPGLWKTLDTPYTEEEIQQLEPQIMRPNTTQFEFKKIRPRIRKLIWEGYINDKTIHWGNYASKFHRRKGYGMRWPAEIPDVSDYMAS